MSNLTSSMNLVLDEFYNNLKVLSFKFGILFAIRWDCKTLHMPFLQTVGVSAVTGEGLDEFFSAVDSAREEYLTYVYIRKFSNSVDSNKI